MVSLIVGGVVLASLPLFFCLQLNDVYPELGAKLTPEQMSGFASLANWENGRFKNLDSTELITHSKNTKLAKNLSWLIFPKDKPPRDLKPISLSRENFAFPPSRDFKMWWLGHSSLIMELAGTRFATDLVFDNAAPFPWVVRRYCDSPLSRKDLPALDFLIISHDHYDHLERATIQFLAKTQPNLKFITCLGVGEHLKHWGVPAERIFELNWGENFQAGEVKIYCVPARHFSGRSLETRNQTLWGAFVFECAGRRILFGADSGYGSHFKAIGEQFSGGFDLALFEIDAWNEKWRNIHMTPEEAILAGTDIGARCVVPIHWATFYLAQHPWKESIELFNNAANAANSQVAFPQLGAPMTLQNSFPQDLWWRKID